MRGDEVGDQVLLLAGLLRIAVEQLLEAVVGAHSRLHHLRQRAVAQMLRGDLQIATDVVLREFAHVLGRLDREVIAHTRCDQHLLDAGQRARLAIQLDQRRMVGIEIGADARVDTGRTAAGALDLAALAGQAVHVGGRAAQIGDHAGKARHLCRGSSPISRSTECFRAALDDAALMLGDRAEGAAAEAAALDRDREADHLVGRDRGARRRTDAAGAGTADRRSSPSPRCSAESAAD